MKLTGVAASLAVAALCTACGREPEPAHEEIRPVRSIVVGETSGSVGATYSGEVQARHESKLGFQTSGKVVARLVDVGAHVKRGQPLMRLDPAQESLHVVTAVADVEAARSRVAQDRVDVQRTEQLLARAFASQAELDQQRLALAQSQAKLKAALAQQQITLNQRGYTELVADRDGLVTAVGAEAGQVVSAGQAVVTVAVDGDREVLVSIPESRVDELRRAKVLQVSVWARPDKRYDGELRELAPDTDSVTRTYSARIAVKNADSALMLGMTASVFTPDVDGRSAIRLPLGAIYNQDGRPQVWVIDAKTSQVALRAVQLGSAQNDSVLVSGGLAGGETVVTAGVHMLHAGQKVKAPGASTTLAQGSHP
ncbi:MAG TPA: efflux RND transporter periplasmic adaptor subunit [Albitalea sp.]|uniref:efflux RND transporter periplasmic adaptor subunit n=1 Tax=Piscinibacter sp. TaxID=1903157 RepID=UPI002ED320D5